MNLNKSWNKSNDNQDLFWVSFDFLFTFTLYDFFLNTKRFIKWLIKPTGTYLTVTFCTHTLSPTAFLHIDFIRRQHFGVGIHWIHFPKTISFSSYAGLHCVVIKGYSKSAGYQPGVRFEDNRFRNSWNAVYVAGAWRFVQCNWGARHLVNAKEVPRPGNKSKSDSLR